MKNQNITLTTQNGGTLVVSVSKDDGKLHLLDSDLQMTKDLLPDGVYQSEGLSFTVSHGKLQKSKPSPPRLNAIAAKMEAGRQERKQQIRQRQREGLI